jgi:hypothetical protein
MLIVGCESSMNTGFSESATSKQNSDLILKVSNASTANAVTL